MARKALRVLLPASVAVLVASQWREIARYLKISQMSRGDGHPQAVPAGGKHGYARAPAPPTAPATSTRKAAAAAPPPPSPHAGPTGRPPSLRERCSSPSSP